jgi:hypothetical protein
MTDVSATRESHEQMDALFRALPARHSREYLEHLRDAPTEALPPRVLARAYRESSAKGWEDARERTFERLVRERDGRFDHLGPAIKRIREMVPPYRTWKDREEVLQETIVEIYCVLPTPRGEFAERAWYRFARQCAVEAWRRMEGRRGERIEPPRMEPEYVNGKWTDPVQEALRGLSSADEPDIDAHAFLSEVIHEIADPLIREVAEDLWLSGDPSPISGSKTSSGGKPSLHVQLGGSRDRLVRAADAALARILVELEHRGIPRERLDEYRKKPR